jgi:hypothetical protein
VFQVADGLLLLADGALEIRALVLQLAALALADLPLERLALRT